MPDHHGRIWFVPGALSDQFGLFETRYQLPSRDSAFLAPLVGMLGDEKPIVRHRRANLLKELAHCHIIVSLGPQRKSCSVHTDGKSATARCSAHASGRCIFNPGSAGGETLEGSQGRAFRLAETPMGLETPRVGRLPRSTAVPLLAWATLFFAPVRELARKVSGTRGDGNRDEGTETGTQLVFTDPRN